MKSEVKHCRYFNPQRIVRIDGCPRQKDHFDEYVSIISKCVGIYDDFPCKYYEE